MEKFLKILQFFRIVDNDNRLSLTNIAVMIAMYKICVTKGMNLNDAGLLTATLLNYAHKRWTNTPDAVPTETKIASIIEVNK